MHLLLLLLLLLLPAATIAGATLTINHLSSSN
jgi:hypothetical protein